jgi:hypothetical protein
MLARLMVGQQNGVALKPVSAEHDIKNQHARHQD